MPVQYQNWTIDRDDSNLLWLRLNTADSRTNILSEAVFGEFQEILDDLANDVPPGVALLSGKSKGFIAGADIKEFTQITDSRQALEKIRTGQHILDQLDRLPCPTIAVVNGFCVGGGLELALACDFRIALDDPGTRFSFPEVKLGIHPGYGGTVRVLRHVNPLVAMDLILTGRSIDARRAKKIGLIDYLVPHRQLENAARQLLLNPPSRHRVPRLAKLLNYRPARPVIASQDEQTTLQESISRTVPCTACRGSPLVRALRRGERNAAA